MKTLAQWCWCAHTTRHDELGQCCAAAVHASNITRATNTTRSRRLSCRVAQDKKTTERCRSVVRAHNQVGRKTTTTTLICSPCLHVGTGGEDTAKWPPLPPLAIPPRQKASRASTRTANDDARANGFLKNSHSPGLLLAWAAPR